MNKYPVIATTSKLLNTGVDARTCKLIVLDQNIQSMTTFKQIIGRGTRILEEYGKTRFTIMDFKTEFAWRVSLADIAARGYNLDVKNPHTVDDAHRDPAELLAEYQKPRPPSPKCAKNCARNWKPR